jgi:hypothetical protein
MTTFQERVVRQREILNMVNSLGWEEELHGLTAAALERWASRNMVPRDSQVVIFLYKLSHILHTLAHHSQDPLLTEHESASQMLTPTLDQLSQALSAFKQPSRSLGRAST